MTDTEQRTKLIAQIEKAEGELATLADRSEEEIRAELRNRRRDAGYFEHDREVGWARGGPIETMHPALMRTELDNFRRNEIAEMRTKLMQCESRLNGGRPPKVA